MDFVAGVFDLLRWLVSVPLLLISLYFIITNLRFLFVNIRLGLDAGPAPVTIIGGLSGCLGFLIMPALDLGERLAIAWIPLFVDLGSAPFYLAMFGLAVWQRLDRKLWRKRPDYVDTGTN